MDNNNHSNNNHNGRVVKLEGGIPWGFSLQGGADFRAPLKIIKVHSGGKAHLAGLQVGDTVLKIGNTDCSQLRHNDALFQIRLAGDSVSLTVMKGAPPPTSYLSDANKNRPVIINNNPPTAKSRVTAHNTDQLTTSTTVTKPDTTGVGQANGNISNNNNNNSSNNYNNNSNNISSRSDKKINPGLIKPKPRINYNNTTNNNNDERDQQQKAIQQQQRDRELQKQEERRLQQEFEKEQQKGRQLQQQKEKELKQQKEKELQQQKEKELQQQKDKEIKQQKEKELQQQKEKELQQQKEKELQLQKEKELKERKEKELQQQKEKELKQQKEKELQLQKEKELQLQKENELQLQKEKELQLQKEKELQFQKEKEKELQEQKEKEFQQQKELQQQQSTNIPFAKPRQTNAGDKIATQNATVDSSKRKKKELKPPPANTARGLFDFTAESKYELSFSKGDVLTLLRTVDANWLEAECDGQKGIIPIAYVELLGEEIKTEPHAIAKYNFDAEESYELPFKTGDCISLISWIDENWLQGKREDHVGIFPASYVDVITPLPSESGHTFDDTATDNYMEENQIRAGNSLNGNSVKHQGELYEVLYTYKPQNTDELELVSGDSILVINKCDDGWYMGYSQASGVFGTFPGNYVQTKQ